MTDSDTSNMTDDQLGRRYLTVKEKLDTLWEELQLLSGGKAEVDNRALRLECFFEALKEENAVPDRVWLVMDIHFFEKTLDFIEPHIEELRDTGGVNQPGRAPLAVVKNPSVLLGPDGRPLTGG